MADVDSGYAFRTQCWRILRDLYDAGRHVARAMEASERGEDVNIAMSRAVDRASWAARGICEAMKDELGIAPAPPPRTAP